MAIDRSRCYSCGKGVAFGNNVSHANNKTRRTWKPNLQVARIVGPEGKVIKVKVCTGYRHRGDLLREFPVDRSILSDVQPEYETLPGWREDISGLTRYDDMPRSTRRYVESRSLN